MANIRISQLPAAPTALTGAELVPITQNGQTVQTTVADIANSPTQTQTFLTVGLQSSLPNSRYIGGGLGIGTSDGGAQGLFSLFLNGTSASLENAATGIIVKSGVNTVVPRSIAVATAGLSIANGSGVSGNPTISLTGLALSAATLTGNGMVSLVGGSYFQNVTLTGTVNQISIANPNGGSNPTFSISDNPTLPGLAGTTIPSGTTGQRASIPVNGTLRYNTTTGTFEGYANGSWGAIVTGSGVTSVGTGNGLLGGPITSTGTITIDTTVVVTWSDTQTLTNKTISGSSNTITNIGNSSLTNSSVTYNGVTVALGSSGTITAANPNALTIGTGLSGTSYDGSSAVTIAIANTGVNAATYGSSSSVPVFAVNAQGQITSVTNTTINAVALTTGTISTSPSASTDIANKAYVDTTAQGLSAKASCRLATTANITLSGNQTIDGVTTVTGNRILVKNQSSSQFNGIYVAAAGAWTRAADMDVWSEVPGSFVFITAGSTQANTGWTTTAADVGTIDVTAMPWVQFSGAGTYLAGTGLTLTGNTFSITNTAVTAGTYGTDARNMTLTVNAQGQITALFDQPIALAASQITSGTLAVARGGTNIASYTVGDILYASGTTTLSKLALGTTNYVMTAGASAPQYVAQSTLSVGNATNAANVAITTGAATTNYLAFVTATTGNLPVLTNTGLTYNSSTNAITGGINGGTF